MLVEQYSQHFQYRSTCTTVWLLPLGIGMTEDVFHAVGNFPERMDMFISFVIPGQGQCSQQFVLTSWQICHLVHLTWLCPMTTTSPGSHLRCKVSAQGMSLGQAD